ncbi:PRC-barrel domain-containing protein [Streptomyces sp. NPDC016309]|uniref:PRC-barrel domain-containing protein n=1 Tax=Streptomyces sp. NPDC016309 TaxID=3364965 RepID=UPI0036F752E1
MIPQEQLTSLTRRPVHSADGDKIGDVVRVLLDDTTGRAEWALVRGDSSGPGEVFVPLRDAVLAGDHVEVPFPAAVVAAAARVDVPGREVLSVADESRLFACYGVRDVRERVNAERGSGWSEMDRAAGIRAGTEGQEEARTRLRVLGDDGA